MRFVSKRKIEMEKKMAEIVYSLCFLLSVLCSFMLFRKYKKSRINLLLYTGVAFALIAINNIILFLDLVVFPDAEFNGALLRIVSGALGSTVLLFGLIWEAT